ncbi:MAG TPA: proline--tRNA ligase [Acidobacteriaceae bacterium]
MHRWSQLFVPTLREAPADAEVASHKFLLRAGYIRQVSAGVYSYLFLGQRSLNKIIAIVREEMDRIGQEFYLPALLPRDLLEESGRWTIFGDNLFRLKDRKGAEVCLGMTHEEVVTSIARNELRSYKQLPQIWYQIQTKFRDEPRPRSGLLRVRQFTMKDAYSFDIDAAGLDESYRKHDQTYRAIFTRCGLSFVVVEADSGAMGGSGSQEFMVYTDAGEDLIASCAKCGYAANIEKATSNLAPVEDLAPTGDGKPERIHTPGKAAIADIVAFLNMLPQHDIKALAYMATAQDTGDEALKSPITFPVVVFLRGDHFANETKLQSLLHARELRYMTTEELERYFKGPAGYLGPIGLDSVPPPIDMPGGWSTAWAAIIGSQSGKVIFILDDALEGRTNMVAGANELDYHFRNVTPGRDFTPTVTADVRNAVEGEGCPTCGVPLKIGKAVEIGHIFKLGYRYSESMGARVLDANGKEVMPTMGCYGIGMERILTAAIEQNHDDNGFWLPPSIAPFDVVITVTNIADPELLTKGEQLARDLEAAGFDVLLDDRGERAGVKFKDADLIGIPWRINVGKKAAEGLVELVARATAGDKSATRDLPLGEIAAALRQTIGTDRPGLL